MPTVSAIATRARSAITFSIGSNGATGVYRASIDIESTGEIGGNADVTLEAGSHIVLKPGFKVNTIDANGSYTFHAKIQSCSPF